MLCSDRAYTASDVLGVIFAVMLCICGQSVQNIYLPIVLSSGNDMGVVMVFTAMFYFMTFTLLDVVMDLVVRLLKPAVMIENKSTRVLELRWSVPQHEMLAIGLLLSLNGIGALFGGSSTRTPLTVQMCLVLLISGFTPVYRALRSGGVQRFKTVYGRLSSRARQSYVLCMTMYVCASGLVTSDQVSNLGGGNWSPFVLMFAGGIFCGLVFNAEQDVVMEKSPVLLRTSTSVATEFIALQQTTSLPLLLLFKREIAFIRQFTTWQFFTSWIAVAVSFAGGSQSGPLTKQSFERAWAEYLTLGSFHMNAFNFGQIATLLAAVYINRYTSTLTLLIGNVSAVVAMFSGFDSTIQLQTVGFRPSVWKTCVAAFLAIAAVVPSLFFSRSYHNAQESDDDAETPLIQSVQNM